MGFETLRMPEVKPEFFPLIGGLDLKTARIALKPGRARLSDNYVGVMGGGYRRIGGYERYDGHSKPSYQTYTTINAATSFSGGGLAVGSTVNGATSGATGKVIEIGATNEYLVVTRVTGTFTDTENIRIGATVIGAASATAQTQFDSFDNNRLQALVEAEYRTSISAVPGSGAVRGVVELGGTVYAFRNNAGGTAGAIYKETASGWSEVVPGSTLDFNTGNNALLAEGATITNGGAVSATVKRVIIQSGSFGAGNAAGYLVLTTPTGGNWAIADPIKVGVTTVATAATVSAAITISPGGRYEFSIYNFTGSTSTLRIYGCDGVNKGFEFDGTVYAPIRTGMTTDTPKHVTCHKNKLFFSFLGSVQHSSAMSPFTWSAVLGAAEIGIGDTVTGFATIPGGDSSGALMIFARDRIKILYGSSTSDWNLVDFSNNIGASAYSIAKAGNSPIFMDELGISTAKQAQEYGGFLASAISYQVQPLVQGRADDVVACMTSRLYSVYYLFFADDKTGIAITFGAKGIETIMPFTLGVQVNCCWETNRNGGEMFVGCSDGYVYQLERGRSFDGSTVTAFIGLAFTHSNSPAALKSYIRAVVEMKGDSAFTLSATQQLSYDDPNLSSSTSLRFETTALTANEAGAVWEVSSWDESFYDGGESSSLTLPLRGDGINIALNFYSEADDELPHELQGVILHYVMRRLWRGR